MSFESILASISDEDLRGQLSTVAEKHPQVRQYVELGERFAPIQTRFGTRWDETIGKLEAVDPGNGAEDLMRFPEWVEYHNRNWDPVRRMYKQQAAAVDENELLLTRVRELEAKGSAEMTLEEIKASLVADGYVKKDDPAFTNAINKDQLLGALNQQATRFEQIYKSTLPLAVEHHKTFGEAIPINKIMEEMAANPNLTAEKAYDIVVAPKRRELELANHKAEVEAAEKRGEAKGATDALARINQPGMPVSSGGTGASGSHFMNRIMHKRAEAAKAATGGRLGDGTAAREGFGKYLQKQGSSGSV